MPLEEWIEQVREKFRANPILYVIMLVLLVIIIFLFVKKGSASSGSGLDTKTSTTSKTSTASKPKPKASEPKVKTVKEVHYVPDSAMPKLEDLAKDLSESGSSTGPEVTSSGE